MYPGGGPVRAGVENFGFPAHFHDMLHEFPICHVNALLAGTLDTTAKDPSADLRQSNLAAEEKQNQPKAEQQGGPEEQSMDTSSGADGGHDQEKEEMEKRKEAKAQEKKVKLEEKRKKLAAAAALLEGRNADGFVSDLVSAFILLFFCAALLFSSSSTCTSASSVLDGAKYRLSAGSKKVFKIQILGLKKSYIRWSIVFLVLNNFKQVLIV